MVNQRTACKEKEKAVTRANDLLQWIFVQMQETRDVRLPVELAVLVLRSTHLHLTCHDLASLSLQETQLAATVPSWTDALVACVTHAHTRAGQQQRIATRRLPLTGTST